MNLGLCNVTNSDLTFFAQLSLKIQTQYIVHISKRAHTSGMNFSLVILDMQNKSIKENIP